MRTGTMSVRLVERARIVLLAAAGKQDQDVAADLGITAQKVALAKAVSRFGISGLEKDAPRPGRTPSISASGRISLSLRLKRACRRLS
jgi:hypothetical protein